MKYKNIKQAESLDFSKKKKKNSRISIYSKHLKQKGVDILSYFVLVFRNIVNHFNSIVGGGVTMKYYLVINSLRTSLRKEVQFRLVGDANG